MPAVSYTFTAAGQAQVAAAFKSISAAASQAASASTAALGRVEKAAGRAATKTAAHAKRGSAKSTSATERAAAKQAAIVEKAEAKAARVRARYRLKNIRKLQQAAAKEVRIAKQAAEKKARAEIAAAKKVAAARRRMAGAAGGAALRGAGALGAVATGLVGVAARDSIRLQDQATRIAIKGSGSVGQRDAQGNIIQRTDPTTLRKSFERTATRTGATAGGVASGVSAFVTKTGDLGKGKEFQDVLAKVAVATGTDLAELGNVAADLFQKFDVTTVEDMNTALSTLAVQGKRGAFEMEDLAANASKLTAAAQFFGGGFKGQKGVAVLGGLTQIARQATPSGAEAATAVNAMFTQLLTKSKAIKTATGADVFADKGKTRTNDFRKVLTDVISGSGGNIAELSKIFGKRGIKAISPLVSKFNEAREASRGKGGSEAEQTAAGLKALNNMLSQTIASTGAVKQIQDDYAIATTTTSHRLTAAWEGLKATVGERLRPVLTNVIEKMAKLATNTNAVDALVTVFVALAQAAELAVDGLESLGLIEKKKATPLEKLDAAQRNLKAIERREKSELGEIAAERDPLLAKASTKGGLTGDEQTKLQALNDKLVQTSKKFAGERKAQEQIVKQQSDIISPPVPEGKVTNASITDPVVKNREAFVDKFVKAGTFDDELDAEGSDYKKARADTRRNAANAIFTSAVRQGAQGEGRVVGRAGLRMDGGTTAAQEEMIAQLKSQATAAAGGMPGQGPQVLADAGLAMPAQKLSLAADKLAAAADKVGKPSIGATE